MGARSPACSATSVNRARKGRPDGLLRGTGFTPRNAMPLLCAGEGIAEPASKLNNVRRVIASQYTPDSPHSRCTIPRSSRPMTTRRALLLLPGACSLGRALGPPEPRNFSFPLRSTVIRLTPWDLFFVREHFPAPEVSPGAWRLTFEGRVRRRIELSLPDLIESPARKL